MDKPLTHWYCDVCGERIEDVKSGYVVWDSVEGHGFKIIHKKRCDSHEHNSSKALDEFLGPEGLTYLLAKLSAGPILKVRGEGSPRNMPNLDDYVDFVRRVQTPFYEEARRLFGTKKVLDDFCDANQYMPYLSKRLESMILEKDTE